MACMLCCVLSTHAAYRVCFDVTLYFFGMQWRQKLRKPDHQLIVKEAGEEVTQVESESSPGGFRKMLQRGQKKEMDVRERTSGILLSDRTESEDQPFD